MHVCERTFFHIRLDHVFAPHTPRRANTTRKPVSIGDFTLRKIFNHVTTSRGNLGRASRGESAVEGECSLYGAAVPEPSVPNPERLIGFWHHYFAGARADDERDMKPPPPAAWAPRMFNDHRFCLWELLDFGWGP
jgi:hypothetical protein